MRLGLVLSEFGFAGGTAAIGSGVAALVKRAEETGFASCWVMDHFFQVPIFGAAEDPMPDASIARGFAASVAERIELGTLVTGVTCRHPGLPIKTMTTLDPLSGGQAYLGMGAAWNGREPTGLGSRSRPWSSAWGGWPSWGSPTTSSECRRTIARRSIGASPR